MHSSMRAVSNFKKFRRPPSSLEVGSREKYTSFAREPPICMRAVSACEPKRAGGGSSYVDGDVADDSRVVGQADVLGAVLVLMVALGGVGGARLVVDNKGALHVDVDVTRVLDCGVVLGGLGGVRELVVGGLVRQRRRHGGELLDATLRLVGGG